MNSKIQNDPLKPRYRKMIKNAITLYEVKQYKKGMKECQTVLKVYPQNGEATSIKGILTWSLGKQEEGEALVKKGLSLNIKSYLCWHIYGILHRNKKDYKMAIKCYSNALKIFPENTLIIRDLALMQLHEGMISEYKTNATKMLEIQFKNKAIWVACITASYLSENMDETKKMINKYFQTKKATPEETNHLLLFELNVVKQSESPQEYFNYLQSKENIIFDNSFIVKEKAETLLRLNKPEEAKSLLFTLIKNEPCDSEAHELLLKAFSHNFDDDTIIGEKSQSIENENNNIDNKNNEICEKSLKITKKSSIFDDKSQIYKKIVENSPNFAKNSKNKAKHAKIYEKIYEIVKTGSKSYQILKEFYIGLFKENPKSLVVIQHCLVLLHGEKNNDFSDFLKNLLRRIVGSKANLYRLLKPALKQENKRKILLTEVDCILKEIDGGNDENHGENAEVNLRRFLALFYFENGEYERALEEINRAIEISDKDADLLLLKGDIFEAKGENEKAFEFTNSSRLIDNDNKNNRFINVTTAKRAFKIGEKEKAHEIIYEYIKENNQNKDYLADLNYLWYFKALAEREIEEKNFEAAISSLNQILNYIEEIKDDQLDFHLYCFYKGILMPYLKMNDFLNSRNEIDLGVKTRLAIIFCYLSLFDEKKDKKFIKMANEINEKLNGKKFENIQILQKLVKINEEGNID